MKEVVVPPFAESVSEGDVRWDKKIGDLVKEDDVLCEIETDKTSVPVPAPGSGVIKEIFAKDGQTVKSGQKLCVIDIGATDGAPAASKVVEKVPSPPPSTTAAAAAPPPPPPPPPPSPPPPPPLLLLLQLQHQIRPKTPPRPLRPRKWMRWTTKNCRERKRRKKWRRLC